MVAVKFIADFADKVIDDVFICDGQLASQLISEGVAELAEDQTGATAKTIKSKKRSK